MSENKKVSIIVPIYKVEKYIHRCVNSILNQTYTNLEVILVNDGSPDTCGKIADQYKKQDGRVKVIHKQNGGLSDARNHGMKYVTGDFTMFIDSDDWIERDMVEIMITYSTKYQADIVQSAFYYAYEEKLLIDTRCYKNLNEIEIFDKKTLMYQLVKNEKVKNFAWGKLYKTEIIRDIPFEKDLLFEDVFWAHHVMHKVDTYVLIHEPLYNYCQRNDSIVATYTPRNLDIIKGLKERHVFIEENYKELINESYKILLRTCLIHYNLLFLNREIDAQSTHKKGIRSYILLNYPQMIHAIEDDKELKKQLVLFTFHPYCYIAFLAWRKGQRTLNSKLKKEVLKEVRIK